MFVYFGLEAEVGLIREFEIARSSGLLLVPVGATEYAMRVVYARLLADGYFDSDVFPSCARKYITELGVTKADLASLKESLSNALISLS